MVEIEGEAAHEGEHAVSHSPIAAPDDRRDGQEPQAAMDQDRPDGWEERGVGGRQERPGRVRTHARRAFDARAVFFALGGGGGSLRVSSSELTKVLGREPPTLTTTVGWTASRCEWASEASALGLSVMWTVVTPLPGSEKLS